MTVTIARVPAQCGHWGPGRKCFYRSEHWQQVLEVGWTGRLTGSVGRSQTRSIPRDRSQTRSTPRDRVLLILLKLENRVSYLTTSQRKLSPALFVVYFKLHSNMIGVPHSLQSPSYIKTLPYIS